MSAQYISYVVYTIKSKSDGEFTENILASITETKERFRQFLWLSMLSFE